MNTTNTTELAVAGSGMNLSLGGMMTDVPMSTWVLSFIILASIIGIIYVMKVKTIA